MNPILTASLSSTPAAAAASPSPPADRPRTPAMPSWNDGESSSTSPLGEVMNCGFVSWVDKEEWPDTMNNSLDRLWHMYFEANMLRIADRIDNTKLVQQLSDEKTKIEKKHNTLLDDVCKFMEQTEKKVVKENYKIIQSGEEDVVLVVKERDELKVELEALKKEVTMLKHVQKSQADIMKVKQGKWDEEKVALKTEKNKLEHVLYDLFNFTDGLKKKVKKIKELCDE